jgi:hypothetical protein
MFGAGVLGGLAVLLIPRPVPMERVETVVVERVKVETKEVVKYKDRWRDRVTTIEKPSGERVVIVDRSGETSGEGSKTETKEEAKEERKVTEKPALTRYSLGLVYYPVNSFGLEASARIGNLPVFIGASFGNVSTTGTLTPVLYFNVRYEW